MLNISYGRQQSFICIQCVLLCSFASLQLINHIKMSKKNLKNIQISIIKHKELKQPSLPFFFIIFYYFLFLFFNSFVYHLCHLFDSFFLFFSRVFLFTTAFSTSETLLDGRFPLIQTTRGLQTLLLFTAVTSMDKLQVIEPLASA